MTPLTLVSRMTARPGPAVITESGEISYAQFLKEIGAAGNWCRLQGIRAGDVCAVVGDFSADICAMYLALMCEGAILVPLNHQQANRQDLLKIAGTQYVLTNAGSGDWTLTRVSFPVNTVVDAFRSQLRAGLVVFTSGSTGEPKGILHDSVRVLSKFASPRTAYRTLLFLLPDHFGGFNTLMSVFAYGGTAVIAEKRTPEAVCRIVERARVELLPVTPTFLNLVLMSGVSGFDLSSVTLVTYGTEVMPETTLQRLSRIFPSARFQQTYGLSETGVLRSRSRDSSSTWVKLGGEGFETRIVEGVLHVRSASAMVGYLNAESPIDDDGWMNTGDIVETDGEFVRILGRGSDLINVGGEKVFPAEVENVILSADNVSEAAVFAVPNPVTGHVVGAKVSLRVSEEPTALRARLRQHCLRQLARYKVPMHFTIVSESDLQTERGKKRRG